MLSCLQHSQQCTDAIVHSVHHCTTDSNSHAGCGCVSCLSNVQTRVYVNGVQGRAFQHTLSDVGDGCRWTYSCAPHVINLSHSRFAVAVAGRVSNVPNGMPQMSSCAQVRSDVGVAAVCSNSNIGVHALVGVHVLSEVLDAAVDSYSSRLHTVS